jgi:hypothetical protein
MSGRQKIAARCSLKFNQRHRRCRWIARHKLPHAYHRRRPHSTSLVGVPTAGGLNAFPITCLAGPTKMSTAFYTNFLSACSAVTSQFGRRRFFVIGLPKTGTSSAEEALAGVGINLMRSPENLCLLPMLQRGDFDVFNSPHMAGYHGTTEMIGAIYFQELLHQYPEAHFIYTTREKNSWLRSAESYWNNFATIENELVFQPMGRGAIDSGQLTFALKALFGCVHFDAHRFAAAHDAHHNLVLTCFREARHFMHLPLELPDVVKARKLSAFVDLPITRYPKANALAQSMPAAA